MDLIWSTESIDRLVYQATHDIFVDENAKLRKVKLVKKCIESYATEGSPVCRLISRLGAERTVQTVRKLLLGEAYESRSMARNRFPHLFEASVDQKTARDDSEVEGGLSEQAGDGGIVQAQAQGSKSQGAVGWGDVAVTLRGRLCYWFSGMLSMLRNKLTYN